MGLLSFVGCGVFSLSTAHGRIAGTMLCCYFNKMMCTVPVLTAGSVFAFRKTRPKRCDLTLGNKSIENCGNSSFLWESALGCSAHSWGSCFLRRYFNLVMETATAPFKNSFVCQNLSPAGIYIYTHIYVYIYIYIHTYTHYSGTQLPW